MSSAAGPGVSLAGRSKMLFFGVASALRREIKLQTGIRRCVVATGLRNPQTGPFEAASLEVQRGGVLMLRQRPKGHRTGDDTLAWIASDRFVR
jgi:hypothetical protein